MVRDLNFFYLNHKPFYEIDDSWQGFTWLSVDDANASTIAFSRCDKEGQKIVSVINFSGAEWKNYYIFLEKGKYELVFNSDKISYGGKGSLKKRVFTTKKHEDGRYYISIDIPALSGLYLKKLS